MRCSGCREAVEINTKVYLLSVLMGDRRDPKLGMTVVCFSYVRSVAAPGLLEAD